MVIWVSDYNHRNKKRRCFNDWKQEVLVNNALKLKATV